MDDLATQQFIKLTRERSVSRSTDVTKAITDPTERIIFQLSWQLMNAVSTLEVIASGRFTSTDKEPTYAGGVVSPGNRIYTPAEAARNALGHIADEENMFKPTPRKETTHASDNA